MNARQEGIYNSPLFLKKKKEEDKIKWFHQKQENEKTKACPENTP